VPYQSSSARDSVELECDKDWTDCQKKQMKAKARQMNKNIKKGWINRGPVSEELAAEKSSWQAKFGRQWNNPSPRGRKWPSDADPSIQSKSEKFYHECAMTDDPKGAGLQADHVREVQTGGDPRGPFRWLDATVNASSGSQILNSGVTQITGFTTKNCG
jgi:hypothetical protein